VNVGLSFLRGLAAAVNPCAFVLLPTYLMYFLGMEAGAGGTQRSSVRRALLVSAAVSAGFVVVFVVAGVITNSFTSWLAANAKYVTVVIGVTLVVLGAAMLFGYRLPLTAPAVGGGDSRTVRSMFVYGVGYALASLGCTIALFMSTAFASPDSFTDGMVNVAAFAAGMALIVTALTVSLAVASSACCARRCATSIWSRPRSCSCPGSISSGTSGWSTSTVRATPSPMRWSACRCGCSRRSTTTGSWWRSC
jgi:cytochrome c biogenesis protein CcdA